MLEDTLGAVILYVTHKCNLACTYCLNEFNGSHKDFDLDNDPEYLEKLSSLVDSCKSKIFYIVFFGGEPSLRWDICKNIYYALADKKDKDVRFIIQTNGTLLIPLIEDIKKMPKLEICISADGEPDNHNSCRVFHNGKGSWETVKANVKALLDAGLKDRLAIATSYYPSKGEKLYEYVVNMYELGVEHVRTTVIKEEATLHEHIKLVEKSYDKIAEYVKEHDVIYSNFGKFKPSDKKTKRDFVERFECGVGTGACRAGNYRAFINVDGNMYPCSTMMYPQFLLGNLFSGYRNHKLITAFQNFYNSNCHNCEHSAGSQWCPYKMFLQNGSAFSCSELMKEYCEMKCRVLKNYYKE